MTASDIMETIAILLLIIMVVSGIGWMGWTMLDNFDTINRKLDRLLAEKEKKG